MTVFEKEFGEITNNLPSSLSVKNTYDLKVSDESPFSHFKQRFGEIIKGGRSIDAKFAS